MAKQDEKIGVSRDDHMPSDIFAEYDCEDIQGGERKLCGVG